MRSSAIRLSLRLLFLASGISGLNGCIHDGDGKAASAPRADAGADTVVSIGDSVILRAREAPGSGTVLRWEWDIGNRGSFSATAEGDTVIRVGSNPGVMENVLRAVGEDGSSALDTMRVRIVSDEPVANAGRDTTVTLSDTVHLRGRASDRFGRIVKWEWDVGGTGHFTASSGDTDVVSLNRFGFQYHILRVTDDDGNTALDTMRVTIVDDFPLAKLVIRQRTVSEGGGTLLSGSATDLGRIVKWEWDLGNGTFVPGRSDTVFRSTQAEGDTVRVRVRVTDDDGHTALDSGWFVKTNWQDLGPVSVFPRSSPTGFPILNQVYGATGWKGRIFISGFTETGVPYGSNLISHHAFSITAASYDPETGIWTREAPLPLPVLGNNLVVADSTLFSIGGRSVDSLAGDGLLFEYIPAFKDWFRRRNLPKGLQAGQAVAAGGRIFYAGFLNTGNPGLPFDQPPYDAHALALYSYAPESDDWASEGSVELPPTTGNWRLVGVAAMDGDIYVMTRPNASETCFLRYSVKDKTWSTPISRNIRSEHFALAALGGGLYFLGGTASNPTDKRVLLRYDPKADQWSQASRPAHDHYNASPVVIGGALYDMADDFEMEIYSP